MPSFRKLNKHEILILRKQNCKCENWDNVEVAETFSTEYIEGVTLSGNIKLGVFNKWFEFPGGIKKHSGIYNATLHNCTVGGNSLISNINNYIANYKISEDVIIKNTELIAVDGKSYFGNGISVNVLDETGGRQIPIYNKLSSHTAYMLAFYRHRPALTNSLEKMISAYADTKYSETGHIGKGAKILNCKQIKNTHIGESAIIKGVSRLNNGSINSNHDAPIVVGVNVVADNFIFSSGSTITDNTILTNCFVGQGCILSKHYSAVHSLFFANCQGINGEACSIFAGPYTVTHHKSTLLIAGMFSFLNAGSGSNQSNHMYKLGPIHHGIVERGSKTTSDSYLLWPAKIGSFTLVMGRHYTNPDSTNMPFSYLIENNDKSWLVPGINLQSVGTIRDAIKWPKRDNRKGGELLDSVNFNLLSPYTIQRMDKGQKILENLKNNFDTSKKSYNWGSMCISKNSLDRGIKLYEMAITKFLGNSVISKLSTIFPSDNIEELRHKLSPKNNNGEGSWVDLAGLITPKNEIDRLINDIENKTINNITDVEKSFKNLFKNYYEYEWAWAAKLISKRLGFIVEKITIDNLIGLINNWITSVVELDQLLYTDAQKEFTLNSMTGFGIDGNQEIKKQDFEKVRGTFEKNPFVIEILSHIKRKTELGQNTIEALKNIKLENTGN
jgi:hypothetical protein